MQNEKLTKVENFSVTEPLAKKLRQWNHSEQHEVLGKIGARTVGFMATPVTEAIDAVAHAALFVGKTATGVVVSPYNFIAKKIDPKYCAPRDLELSSAFVHLVRFVDALFRIVTLPLVMLLNPDRGYHLVAAHSKIDEMEGEGRLKEEQRRITELEARIASLESELQAAQHSLNDQSSQYEVELAGAKQKITNLQKEIERLQGQLNGKQRRITELEARIASLESELQKLQYKADLLVSENRRSDLKRRKQNASASASAQRDDAQLNRSGDQDLRDLTRRQAAEAMSAAERKSEVEHRQISQRHYGKEELRDSAIGRLTSIAHAYREENNQAINGLFNWIGSPVRNAVFGGSPDFKQKQNQLIIETIITDLAHWVGENPPRFDSDDDNVNAIQESKKQILEELVRKSGFEENDSSLTKLLLEALGILFVPQEDASVQRSEFLVKLTDIAKNSEYANSRTNAEDRRIQLAHKIAESIITVPQWELFEDVMNKVLAAGGRSNGLGDSLQNRSIVDLLEQEQKAISEAPEEWKMGTVEKNLGKFQGQVGLGFTPSQAMNYFSALFIERYRNNQGIIKTIPVYRFPTATQDGILENKSEVVGAMLLFVDHLRSQGRRHCWFGHQKLKKMAWNHEGARSEALRKLHEENPDTFYFFNLPFDGPVFNPRTENPIEMEKLKKVVLECMLQSEDENNYEDENGFYFPVKAIKQHQGDDFDVGVWIQGMLDQVQKDFFEGKVSLSKEERQTFLLFLYTRMEKEVPLMLDASRNSTCKDGIDRAAVMNALCYYMDMVSLGKHKDPEYLYKFRLVLHHAAFFVKTQGVIPSRMKLVIDALRYLEGLGEDKLGLLRDREHQGFRLESIAHPQVKVRCLGKPSQAINEQQYWAAVDRETDEERIIQRRGFINKIQQSEDLSKDTQSIEFSQLTTQLPLQVGKDAVRDEFIVNGKTLRIESSGDENEMKQNALRQYGDAVYKLTEKKESEMWIISTISNQAVTADVYKALMDHYQYQPNEKIEDAEDWICFIQRQPPKPKDGKRFVGTRYETKKVGSGYQTAVTTDYKIEKKREHSQTRIVRATLTIKYDPKYTDAAEAASAQAANTPIDQAPYDAYLTWEVGSPEEFPPMVYGETTTLSDANDG